MALPLEGQIFIFDVVKDRQDSGDSILNISRWGLQAAAAESLILRGI